MRTLILIVAGILGSIALLIATGDLMWLLATFVFSMAGGWQVGRLVTPDAELRV